MTGSNVIEQAINFSLNISNLFYFKNKIVKFTFAVGISVYYVNIDYMNTYI